MPLATIVLLVVGAVLVVLIAIMIVNTIRQKPTPLTKPLPPSQAKPEEGAVERFQEMLRLATIWGAELPDPDHSAFDEFIPMLRRLYPRVFEQLELTTFDTYGIMLRWKGLDSDAQPVILMAHQDVVAVNPDEWTHPPFAAEIADGRIWARGTADTKCILAALFEAVEKLLAEGYTPPRDVYLCSSNCEEDMGETAPHMVDYFREREITPLLVLDEGGAIIDNAPLGVRKPFAVIGVAEKGICAALLTVDSAGGHAATPSLNDATSKLVLGLNNMLTNPPKAQLPAPIKAMLDELTAYAGIGLRLVFGNFWLFKPLILKVMKGGSETAAMVRSTYALTELKGSKAINVIPKQATAGVNIRIDPSESVEKVLARLKSYFNDEAQTEVVHATEPSPISPFDDDVYDYLRRVIHCVYPEVGIAPYIQSSASDARHFALICEHTYRFAGFLFKADQRSAIHAKDETLDVESYLRGLGFYYEFIRNLKHLDGFGKEDALVV
ncbi:MAG: M20/M25/M40 family metallo-hydrolase [Coriobacteriia bacterium]|nr:M20/M25/M40 family metallo-hydrolase [Coriobacteriia bacterium]